MLHPVLRIGEKMLGAIIFLHPFQPYLEYFREERRERDAGRET